MEISVAVAVVAVVLAVVVAAAPAAAAAFDVHLVHPLKLHTRLCRYSYLLYIKQLRFTVSFECLHSKS